MNFAYNLQKAREALSLTLEEFANLIKTDPASVSAWEAGDTYPQPDEMRKLSRVLGIDAESLIPEEELDQYINFSLTNGSSSSAFADVLLVGGVVIGMLPGFLTENFAVGGCGVALGLLVGILLRKLYNKKNK